MKKQVITTPAEINIGDRVKIIQSRFTTTGEIVDIDLEDMVDTVKVKLDIGRLTWLALFEIEKI